MYPLAYYPHNVHFIWMGASMSGQGALAVEAARKTAKVVGSATPEQMAAVQGFLVVPYYTLVRFGRWNEIIAEPKPSFDTLFTRGIWHYARGTAFAATGRGSDADQELAALQQIVADPALAKVPAFSLNPADAILKIAGEVLAGDIAARRKDFTTAVARFDRAVRYEDALVYTEPPDWHAPVRHWLGAALLDGGRAAEAETVYWEDLRRNRENGWALAGLQRALAAQNKTEDSALVEQRFKKAWARADASPAGSRF
jgi:tetratricopeptide (TPR) repeat protein